MKFKQTEKKLKVTVFSLILEKLGDKKFKTFKKILNKKTFWFLAIFFLVLSTFTVGIVAQRNYGFSNFIAKPIVLDSAGIVKRKILSFFTSPETLMIDLKFEDHMKLMFVRNAALEAGTTRGIDNEWINADVRSQGNSYKAKVRLKGGSADQHLMGKKWSFRLKLKKQNTIFGMQEFAVMSPLRRNYLGQWFIRKVYEKEGLITRKYDFINLVLNGEDKGIYVIDERYDKIMLERNHRKEGLVMKVDTTPIFADKVSTNLDYDNYYLSMDLTAFDLDNLLENDISRNQFFTAKDLMEKFRLGKLKTSEVFDIELLARWTAISDVMGAWHGFSFNNMRFYFNPITSKFEPVPDDDFNERSLNYTADIRLFRLTDQYNNSFFLRNLFLDYDFLEEYMRQLVKISDNKYLDDLFIQFDDEIKELSNILAIDYPLYNFLLESKQNIYNNAESLRNTLYFHKGIQAHLKEIEKGKSVEITIANNHSIPMEVLYISNGNSEIYKPLTQEGLIIDGRRFMRPVTHNSYHFEFPTQNTNLTKNLPNLNITYRVIGTEKLLTTEIFPYREFDKNFIYQDFIRTPYNINNFSFLNWDKANNEVHFKKGDWQVSSDIIVPPNQTLIIPQGVSIDLINSAMILSYSPVLIVGSEDDYIEIYSSDNSGQGITLLNAKKDSLIKYVRFNGQSRPDKPGFKLSGAVNFYQSPIHFYEAHFDSNIEGDDYINIIRSDFTMEHSSISNSFSDAIDIDFSNGLIYSSVFSDCGFGNNNGDCVDFSGSIVDVDNIIVNNASDKGISIGEQSIVEINNSIIKGSNIAIAVKDLSETTANNLLVKSSNTGISVFQKKPEFGPASMVINGLDIDDVVRPYLVEESSFLSVNSSIVE